MNQIILFALMHCNAQRNIIINNKLIINVKKCIDECKNDDIHKYEHNNKCYQKCPENTFVNDTNNYVCTYRLINNENITQKLITTSYDYEIV